MKLYNLFENDADAKTVANEILRAFKAPGTQTQDPEAEGNGWSFGVRDWGKWESDYENHDSDDGDDWDQDDDQQVLSAASKKQLQDKMKTFISKYTKLHINVQTGEKNWLEFIVKPRA
jgi:hypothetical protein